MQIVENLDELIKRSCDWLEDYLRTNPNLTEEEKRICDEYSEQ